MCLLCEENTDCIFAKKKILFKIFNYFLSKKDSLLINGDKIVNKSKTGDEKQGEKSERLERTVKWKSCWSVSTAKNQNGIRDRKRIEKQKVRKKLSEMVRGEGEGERVTKSGIYNNGI